MAGNFLAAQLIRDIAEKRISSRIDLIHAHSALPCGHAASILSERLLVPFVVSVHGLDAFFTRQVGPILGSRCRPVAEDVYRAARVVICISEKVREQVLCRVRANTTVVYNAVDEMAFFPAPESTIPPAVLSVGNLIPTKQHELLLRAFAQISAAIPDCSLEIIGDGPERSKLERVAAELKIRNSVRFLGRRSPDFVADAMRRCTAFALPSEYEGLGCVYLEAMACGKPTIGCSGQGIDEVIQHGKTGLLISPGNTTELAGSLRQLLLDRDLCRRLGTAARDLVLQRFTVRHHAQELSNIYHGCLA
jgi:glycosyltransferase involved in cell wall biosynthesis